jgi:hypothetical protein
MAKQRPKAKRPPMAKARLRTKAAGRGVKGQSLAAKRAERLATAEEVAELRARVEVLERALRAPAAPTAHERAVAGLET